MTNNAALPAWINDQNAGGGELRLGNRVVKVNKLPHSLEAEMNVLGTLIVASEVGNLEGAIRPIKAMLTKNDFYIKRHGAVWDTINKLHDRGLQADILTLSAELARMGVLDKIGGEVFLQSLMDAAPAPMALDSHAKVIVENALRRQLIAMSQMTAEAAYQGELPAVLSAAHKAHTTVASRALNLDANNSDTLSDLLARQRSAIQRDLALGDDFKHGSIPTGFPSFDKVTRWIKKGLFVFSAPPGWGKSAFLLCAALNALKIGKRVLFISLEMPRERMTERLVAVEAEIDTARLNDRDLNAGEVNRLMSAFDRLEQFGLSEPDEDAATRASDKFIIAEMLRPTPSALRAKIDEIQATVGVDMVIVDYIGDNTLSWDGARDENSVIQAAYRELVAVKMGYDVPVLVAHQMNRNWVQRRDKKPTGIGDLIYGGAADRDADFIAFIYHPHEADDLEPADVAQLIIAKNRYGRTDISPQFYWYPQFTKFTSTRNLTTTGERS